jgi:hypothetical protein
MMTNPRTTPITKPCNEYCFILKSGTILVTREGYKGRKINSQNGLRRYMKLQPAIAESHG